jgi:hypothetical protein
MKVENMDNCQHQFYYKELSKLPDVEVIKCNNCQKILGFLPAILNRNDYEKFKSEIDNMKKELEEMKYLLQSIANAL